MERSSPDDARLDGKEINPSIRGIELHGIGEDSPILLQQSQVWSTGSDRTAALDIEIKQYDVAKYLRLVSALSTLRWSAPDVFAKDLEKAGLRPRESMRDYQFRYLVRILLQSSAKWNSGAIPTIAEIAKHCEWVPNTWCEADLEFVESDSDDMWPSLWRMAYQQFHDLEGEAGLLRSIVIYRQLAPKHAAHHTYPLYDKFKEITGFELDNFWWLSLTLKGWFGRHPGQSVTLKDLVQDTAVLGITEESIQCYLKLVSCTRNQFIKASSHPKTSKAGFELYNLDPLLKWPLVQMEDSTYCAPIPRSILRRAGDGIYYDLMPDDEARFGAVLGEAFQEYVGLILQGLPGVPEIFPEQKYREGSRKLVTCDWIIVDGSTVVLVECKRSAINAMSKITGDRALIQRDLCVAHGVVDGVLKTIETQKAIQKKSPGLEQFFGAEIFYGVVVTLDDFYLPNSQMIREIVAKELGERNEVMNDNVQLTHIGGLEWLVGLLRHPCSSIAEVMKDKTGSTHEAEMDFKNFVDGYSAVKFPGWQVTNWMPAFDHAYEELKATIPSEP